MISRFHINNFRCLQNFDLPIAGKKSALLIGRNGAGKTTVAAALEILQKIARGTNRVGDLVKPKDFTRGLTDVPIRFEIEAELKSDKYSYSVAFELPGGFKELRVLEETLTCGGKTVYTRNAAQVHLQNWHEGSSTKSSKEAGFVIDWHLVALPIIQFGTPGNPISVFKQWLAQMLLLQPIPALIHGNSEGETLLPNRQVTDLGAWFTGLLALAPSAYTKIDNYLRQLLPDLKDIRNPLVGPDARSMVFHFANEQGSFSIPFDDLSDGEKCFVICSLVFSANEAYGPLVCFWDEPDNYLSLDEVGHFMMALRKEFQNCGQFIATSHHPEAIRRFSKENTIALFRRNHLEPTIARTLDQMNLQDDLISTILSGDLRQ